MEFIITPNDEHGVVLADRAFGGVVTALPHTDNVIAGGTRRVALRASERDVVSSTDGDRGLMLLGTHRIDVAELTLELRSYRAPGDAYSIFRRVPGNFFTILTWGRQVYVFGTLSSSRRVVVNEAEVLVASDGDVLRRASGLAIDESHVPLLLLVMQPPSLLNDRLPWAGVRGVKSTDAVILGEHGLSTVTRWSPPQASDRLHHPAVSPLREAIRTAVDARHGSGRVSTDLSGGMDSTTIAFFAHQSSPDLLTVFRPGIDQSNDDDAWTQKAMRALPGSEHVTIPADANQPWYSGWLAPGEFSLESPMPSSRSSEYFSMVADVAATAGSTRHFTGIGGDELFHPAFSLIRAHARSRPAWALRSARAAQAMGRWPTSEMLRALYSRESYGSWRRRVADQLTEPAAIQGTPPTDWEPRPMLPPWATSATITTVRQIVLDDADQDSATGDISQHEALSLITLSGSILRRYSPIFEARGVTYEAPFLDDHIIELALSIDPVDRIQGAAYKPVLSAAGAGVVPAELLGRQTKGDYSREAFDGMRHTRAGILEEFSRSKLAERGLIDVDRFRAAITGVHSDTRMFQFLDPTLTAEAWLRQVGHTLRTTEIR
ncbi:asparagine synthase-related protein [Microbacterium lacticum]